MFPRIRELINILSLSVTLLLLRTVSSLCVCGCADGAELQRGSLGEAEQGEGPAGLVQSHVVVAGTTQGPRHQQ